MLLLANLGKSCLLRKMRKAHIESGILGSLVIAGWIDRCRIGILFAQLFISSTNKILASLRIFREVFLVLIYFGIFVNLNLTARRHHNLMVHFRIHYSIPKSNRKAYFLASTGQRSYHIN